MFMKKEYSYGVACDMTIWWTKVFVGAVLTMCTLLGVVYVLDYNQPEVRQMRKYVNFSSSYMFDEEDWSSEITTMETAVWGYIDNVFDRAKRYAKDDKPMPMIFTSEDFEQMCIKLKELYGDEEITSYVYSTFLLDCVWVCDNEEMQHTLQRIATDMDTNFARIPILKMWATELAKTFTVCVTVGTFAVEVLLLIAVILMRRKVK